MTKVEQLKYYIKTTKEKPTHSLSQEVETWVTLIHLETELKREKKEELKNRKEVLLRLGIKGDSIGIDK